MLRLAEIALLLAPFAAFALWRLLASGGGPTPALVGAAAGALVLIAAALFWLTSHNALGPGEAYVPAQMQNGRIVPGHAAHK
jgi:hypothetical protein